MKTTTALAFVSLAIWHTSTVQALTIDTVPVGNPGNIGDEQGVGSYGSVASTYEIGSTEVTCNQYVGFLNDVDPNGVNALGLYIVYMSNDEGGIDFDDTGTIGAKYIARAKREEYPVKTVSFYDAIRFANWLQNGQNGGDTESGAYTLLGGTPIPLNGPGITRNVGARWFVPSGTNGIRLRTIRMTE